jgi:hypothetical protein
MNTDANLIQRLSRSKLFNEFKQAFCVCTGLPLTLRPEDFWKLAHRGQPSAFWKSLANSFRLWQIE